MTAAFLTGWAALLHHVTMGRAAGRRALGAAALDTNCPEGWLSTVFTGTSRFTTTYPDANSDDPLTIGVDFNPARDQVCISKFPPIDSGRATVTYAGGPLGTFDPATGVLDLTLTLHFDVDAGPFGVAIDEDSTLPISLSTTGDRRASPVDRTSGEATLVGTGDFQGGDVLDGYEGTLVLEGRFSPNPFPDNEDSEQLTPPPSGTVTPVPPRSMGGTLEAVLHMMMQ
jgi:hypothetical protein